MRKGLALPTIGEAALLFLMFYLFVWLCACHDDVCKLEVNLESVLSFHYVSPRDYTQVIRLGGRGPYVPSQSDCPWVFFP